MKILKEEILKIVNEEDWDALQNIIQIQGKKKGKQQSALEESVCEFSRQEQEQLWKTIVNFTANALEDENALNNDEHVKSFQPILSLASIQVDALFTKTKQYEPPNGLVKFAVIIGNLLDEFKGSVENPAINLCEQWVLKNFEGADEIKLSVLWALIALSLRTPVVKQTVKRVWCLRAALSSIPSKREDIQVAITKLLLTCASSTTYISCEEGIKFLSLLLATPKLTKSVHKALKYQLPVVSKTQCTKYAEVYFRAWKGAQDDFKKTLENECLQDLMYLAAHADQSKSKLPDNLFAFMHHIHQHKKHLQTATMIYKLYEHFIWRSFTVANGYVRANATALFCDAFPFTDSTLGQEDKEVLLKRQYDTMLSLLTDPCHLVRLEAVKGVFNILFEFWLMVPSHVIHELFQIFLGKSILDASTAEIRVEVLKGLTLLLDCPDAGVFVGEILPKVSEAFDDVNPAVRVASVEMLLKVKATRLIKFWKLVPMEHLLIRLVDDTKTIQLLITHLIESSFLPQHLDEQEMTLRCVSLIEMNREAARRFYQHSSKKVDIKTATEFMLFIWRTLNRYARTVDARLGASTTEGEQSRETESPSRKSRKKKSANSPKNRSNKENTVPAAVADSNAEDSQKDDSTSANETKSPLDDPETILGLLDVIIIIWTIKAPQLRQSQNSHLGEALKTRISKTFMFVFTFFKENDQIRRSLLYFSSFLPQSLVPCMVGSCVSKLKTIAASEFLSEDSSYTTYLNALCNWNRMDDVVDLILEGLEPALSVQKPKEKSSKKKRGKGVCFKETECVMKPLICLRFFRHLLEHPLNKIHLLQSHRPLLLNVFQCIQNIKPTLEKRFESGQPLDGNITDEFLLQCWTDYHLVVTLLNHKRVEDDHNARSSRRQESMTVDNQSEEFCSSDIYEDLIEWMSDYFTAIAPASSDMFLKCSEELLRSNCDLIAIGRCELQHVKIVDQFLRKFIDFAPFRPYLFCLSCRLVAEVNSFSRSYAKDDEELNLFKDIFEFIFKSFADKNINVEEMSSDDLKIVMNSTQNLISQLGSKDAKILRYITSSLVTKTISCLSAELEKNRLAVPHLTEIKDLGGEAQIFVRIFHEKSKLINVFVICLQEAFEQEISESVDILSSLLLLDLLVKVNKHISPHALQATAAKAKQLIEQYTHLAAYIDTEEADEFEKFCVTEATEMLIKVFNAVNK